MGAGMFFFFLLVLKLSVCIVVGLVVIKAPFFVTEDTGHLSFSAFSWWSLYYVKASVP